VHPFAFSAAIVCGSRNCGPQCILRTDNTTSSTLPRRDGSNLQDLGRNRATVMRWYDLSVYGSVWEGFGRPGQCRAALSLLVNDASMSSLFTFARMGTTQSTSIPSDYPMREESKIRNVSLNLVRRHGDGGGRALFLLSQPRLDLVFASHNTALLQAGWNMQKR
jgi:hypothetical protein